PEQLAQTMGADLSGGPSLLSRADLAEIRDEMKSDPAVQAAIGALWPILTPQQWLADLLADQARLDKAARSLEPEERAELLRPDTGEFSAADAPLLDELAELLGVDDAEERERARRRWRAKIAEAQDALDILTGSAPQDLRSEEHTSELQSRENLVCRLLLEKKKKKT